MNSAADSLLPVEQLLFNSSVVKIGRFNCPADHPCFEHTAPMHNNLFVMTHKPLWWRRSEGGYRFAEPGAALLHREGGEIERRSVCQDGDFTDWFGIRQDLFEEVLERNQLDKQHVTERPVAILTSLNFRLREALLIRRLQSGAPAKSEIEETTLLLFDDVCASMAKKRSRTARNSQTRLRRRRLAERARALLDGLQQEAHTTYINPGLEEIAGKLGSSVYHLCRVFREECGLTLHAYRQRQRLGRAIDLMTSSKQDLTTLALNLGYSSHSHFTRVFRQHLGVSPSMINLG